MSAADKIEIAAEQSVPLSCSLIVPSLSHKIYSLIGFAWPCFGFLFLILLCDSDWFTLPIPIFWLFPVFCLVAILSGHVIASVLESRPVTQALYYFRHGMPLFFYKRFAVLQSNASSAISSESTDPAAPNTPAAPNNQAEPNKPTVQSMASLSGPASQNYGRPAIVFGARRILLAAVDELYLTILGSLEIKSYAASGKLLAGSGQAKGPVNKADLLARVPIGALSLPDQKRLVTIFKQNREGLVVNKRLEDRLGSPIVKGQVVISSIGAVILLYALFDVGYATFTWLEMLKDYYGCQICILHPDKAEAFLSAKNGPSGKGAAEALFERAESLRTHPSPLSWAYRALFSNGNSAAQLLAIKAESLYCLGRKDEAVAVLKEALLLKPTGYKVQLQLARWLAVNGRSDEARLVLDSILEKHKDVLMPRVYNFALMLNDDQASRSLYKRYLSQLDDEVFGEEPSWPPGGEKPLMEMWRRDDLEFLAPYFLLPHKK